VKFNPLPQGGGFLTKMILERLTQRAKITLLGLPKKSRISGATVIDAITKAEGMGNMILQNVPGIMVPKKKMVSTDDLVKEAYYQSVKFEHMYVGTEHLLLALFKLADSGDYQRLKLALIKLSVFPNTIKTIDKTRKTPILDAFGENLNQKTIKNLDKPVVYRTTYDSLVASLLLKNTSNVLLLGEQGVGKKTLVELLARNITSLDVPPALAGYQVISFDMLAFMTSLFNKGGVEVGLAQLADELRSLNRVILFIKNFQNAFFATATGISIPIFYSMFKSALDTTDVKIIATMSAGLYDKLFAENEHIVEDFGTIEIPEPTEDETKKILESTALYLSEFHNVEISKAVTRVIYKKAKELDGSDKFPQKGVDLMDHCCTYVILKKSTIPKTYKKMVDQSFDLLSAMDEKIDEGRYDKALKLREQLRKYDSKLTQKEEKIFVSQKRLKLTPEDVKEAVSVFKEDKVIEDKTARATKLSNLAGKIKSKIIGQDEAVDTVAKALIRASMGLRSRKRPLGNFLFLGPTGVGKTELAKVLADTYYGEKSLIRLDMSDFSEKHNVARLVGAPPGYVGFGEGGELTTKIENHPDSVVLFDEIEKAHPDVLNILLQIMEEAELVDAKGSSFDFSRAVIILTSNLGTEILHNREIGFDERQMSDKGVEGRLKNNLKKILKPELINRFDEVIIFKRLNKEDQTKILDLLIKEVLVTLRQQRISVTISKEVKDTLLKMGHSEEYGARGLRRTLEKDLLDKLAEFLLEHHKRPLSLQVSIADGKIVVESKKTK
jgi:ATP-dependent Clp protease ATP-binding subunit ClpC